MKQNNWYVYILVCADNSYYTGITVDIKRRIEEHNAVHSKTRYTRTRQPVALVYSEPQRNRSSASKREIEIKKLSRKAKEKLIAKSPRVIV